MSFMIISQMELTNKHKIMPKKTVLDGEFLMEKNGGDLEQLEKIAVEKDGNWYSFSANNQVKNAFDSETIRKIIRGAMIAGGGALVVYILTAVSVLDFGTMTPLITALCAIGINAVREWMKGE